MDERQKHIAKHYGSDARIYRGRIIRKIKKSKWVLKDDYVIYKRLRDACKFIDDLEFLKENSKQQDKG